MTVDATALVAGITTLAAVVVLSIGCGDSDTEPGSGFGEDTAGSLPAPPPEIQRYAVGGRPSSISSGGGYVWVVDPRRGAVQRINPRSKRPIAVETAGFPTDVSADADAAWLALGDRGAVQRLTATEGAGEPIRTAGFPFRIAAGEDSVWAMSEASVERIDPRSTRASERVDLGGELRAITAGEDGVWVARDDEVLKLDAASGDELASVENPGVFEMATGGSAVWTLATGFEEIGDSGVELTRLDPDGSVDGEGVKVEEALDVAAGLGYVWLVGGGTLDRFDPESGRPVGRPIEAGKLPVSVTVGEGSVWVAAAKEGAVYRVTP